MKKAMEKRDGDGYNYKALLGTLVALLAGAGIFLAANAVLPFRQLGPRAESDDEFVGI